MAGQWTIDEVGPRQTAWSGEVDHDRCMIAQLQISGDLGKDPPVLHESIVAVLERAVEAGGSTLTDTQYVDVEGNEGWFQLEHRVYGRAGEECLTCRRARISRTTLAGRTTCYCGVCQR